MPYIKNTTESQAAERKPYPLMDRIEIKQNVFIEMKSEDSDLTIWPVEINVDFLALLRNGLRVGNGKT